LEVVSNIDGYKDYDEIEIKVNPYKIESLVPNPTNSLVTISYEAVGATSAYITGNSNNYIFDPQVDSTSVNVSEYGMGLYNVILICDGEIQNSSKTINYERVSANLNLNLLVEMFCSRPSTPREYLVFRLFANRQ
tara:strand:- start:938 stop:1342 length:405 start_codon:yes stop_codon:yes gene_type:complete